MKTQQLHKKRTGGHRQPMTKEELDNLESEYKDLLAIGVKYTVVPTDAEEMRMLQIRSRLIYYGRLEQKKTKITLRNLNNKSAGVPNVIDDPVKFGELEKLEARYIELQSQGIRYKKRPITLPEIELKSLYHRIYYRHSKMSEQSTDT